jgi:hypothetical protein
MRKIGLPPIRENLVSEVAMLPATTRASPTITGRFHKRSRSRVQEIPKPLADYRERKRS